MTILLGKIDSYIDENSKYIDKLGKIEYYDIKTQKENNYSNKFICDTKQFK